MRILQKLLLTIYIIIVLVLIFAYAPIVCHYRDGIKEYKGHHLRATAKRLTLRNGFRSYKFCTVDGFLMFNEILGLTLVAGTFFLLLKKNKPE